MTKETSLPQTVIALVKDGKTASEIAGSIGRSTDYIYSVVGKARKAGKLPPALFYGDNQVLLAKVVEASQQGTAQRPLAEHLGISRRTVAYLIRLARNKGLLPTPPPREKKQEAVQPKPTYPHYSPFNNPSSIQLRIVREPKHKVEVTEAIRQQVLTLRHRHHYNAQATSDETGVEIADIMDILREDRINALLLAA